MPQDPVTFQDMAVDFPQGEWEHLSTVQRALDQVTLENYGSLASPGKDTQGTPSVLAWEGQGHRVTCPDCLLS